MAKSLEELQRRIGYTFRKIEYLEQAMTHSSYSNESGLRNHHLLCNERLEFLGDSVLSLITSDYLYHRFSTLPEGDLTRMRAAVVCEEALASYSEKISLGDFLKLGKGETACGGAQKPAILADAFEAMLAAIYLDAGGMDGIRAVSDVLLPFIEEATHAFPEMSRGSLDGKSKLQEFIQSDREHKYELEYRLIGESGPDHDKTFSVELYLGANCIGHGHGHSKKAAEQMAAQEALKLFGQI